MPIMIHDKNSIYGYPTKVMAHSRLSCLFTVVAGLVAINAKTLCLAHLRLCLKDTQWLLSNTVSHQKQFGPTHFTMFALQFDFCVLMHKNII